MFDWSPGKSPGFCIYTGWHKRCTLRGNYHIVKMTPSDIIQLIAVTLGFLGVIATLLVNGRKSRWIQEQILAENKKTNGRVTENEKQLITHGKDIVEIKSEIRHLSGKK